MLEEEIKTGGKKGDYPKGTSVKDSIYKGIRKLIWTKARKKLVNMANLKPNERILDFGCYVQSLKTVLPKDVRYTGYDIYKEYTDVKDYSNLDIDTVFAIHVLEHLTKDQLNEALKNFQSMGVKKIMIILPTEYLFPVKFFRWFSGKDLLTQIEHKQLPYEIMRQVSNYFRINKIKRISLTNWIIKCSKKK